ncbi:HTH-type transcriptional activator Btr [compost metagenome]
MSLVSTEGFQFNLGFGKVVCESNWRWNRNEKPFDDFDIWYVWKGEGEVNLNGVSRAIKQGCCYLFRPGDRAEAWHNPDNPLTVTYIHFSVQGASTELLALPAYVNNSPSSFLETYLDRLIYVLMSKEIQFEAEAQLLLKLVLLTYENQNLSEQFPMKGKHTHRLYPVMSEIAAYVRENPGAIVNIASLAEKAFLSPRYFSLKFKEIMGQTIESYIINKKIERAEYLLRFHGMSVSEVSDALGYQSIYFFSRQFKQVRGVSPSRIT